MRIRAFLFMLAGICMLPYGGYAQDKAAILPLEPFTPQDRVLVLAPHPDDEAIGCAGVIQEALKSGSQVRIAFLTNGDHNQFAFIVYQKRLVFTQKEFIKMGETRRLESTAAMESLGLPAQNLVFLGYPDFGTFTLLRLNWGSARPFKSWLTRISAVPYKENLSPGAPYKGENVLADMEKVIGEYKPTKIFVSHPADVNADHKSLYLFLQVALADLEGKFPAPKVYPYLIHSAGWPLPRHYHPELTLEPDKKFLNSPIQWYRYDLSPEAVEKKHQAVLFYKSQTTSSAFYLLAFCRKDELFGDFPDIELSLPQTRPEPVVTVQPKSILEQAKEFFGFSQLLGRHKEGSQAEEAEPEVVVKGMVSYALDGHTLLVRIEKDEEINNHFSVLVDLFGYKHGTPFGSMPKVRIISKYKQVKVFDGRKMIDPSGVEISLSPKEAVLKVPLEVLGDPDFILTSLKTFQGMTPAEALSFRKIVIKGGYDG